MITPQEQLLTAIGICVISLLIPGYIVMITTAFCDLRTRGYSRIDAFWMAITEEY